MLGASGYYLSSVMYPDDVALQIRASSMLWFVLVSVSFLLLLRFLRTQETHTASARVASARLKAVGAGTANPASAPVGAASESPSKMELLGDDRQAADAGVHRTGATAATVSTTAAVVSMAPAVRAAMPASIVPSIRALFRNGPYVTYLWMKVPLAFAGLMPVNFLLYYLKLVQQEENAVRETAIVTMIVVAVAVMSVPILIWAANKYTKRRAMMFISGTLGVIFILASLSPATRAGTYILAVFMGVGAVGTNMLPDAMLADIIDYDELYTGMRAEGVYTVVETNLQQFIEIPAGVAPLLVLSAVGFVNNAGCSCGCGTKCDDTFVRWVCPRDVGYACSTTGELLFGDKQRAAPCTDQNDAVIFWVRVFGIFIPGLCYLLGTIPVYRSKIDPKTHEEIIRQIALRQQGGVIRDPVNGHTFTCDDTADARKQREFDGHFSKSEMRTFERSNFAKAALEWAVQKKLVGTVLLLAVLVVSAALRPTENVVAIALLLSALALLGVPWNLLRLRYLRRCKPSLAQRSNSHGDDASDGRSAGAGDSANTVAQADRLSSVEAVDPVDTPAAPTHRSTLSTDTPASAKAAV